VLETGDVWEAECGRAVVMIVKRTHVRIERVKDSTQRIERARNAVKSVVDNSNALLYLWKVRLFQLLRRSMTRK